jgi:hypothetical protein
MKRNIFLVAILSLSCLITEADPGAQAGEFKINNGVYIGARNAACGGYVKYSSSSNLLTIQATTNPYSLEPCQSAGSPPEVFQCQSGYCRGGEKQEILITAPDINTIKYEVLSGYWSGITYLEFVTATEVIPKNFRNIKSWDQSWWGGWSFYRGATCALFDGTEKDCLKLTADDLAKKTGTIEEVRETNTKVVLDACHSYGNTSCKIITNDVQRVFNEPLGFSKYYTGYSVDIYVRAD